MAKDLQAQIEELKDRVSILEQVLVIGASIIPDQSVSDAVREEDISFLIESCAIENRTIWISPSVEDYPDFLLYIHYLQDEASHKLESIQHRQCGKSEREAQAGDV